jgi:hypothetical protein
VRDDVMNENRDSHVGRRTLVRVGAAAAWTVPVIALAAPASATTTCSGGSNTLTAVTVADSQTQSGTPKLSVSLQVVVCNTGTQDTCGLFVTASGIEASTKLNSLSVGDWPATTSGGGGSSNLTASAPSNAQLAGNTCNTYLVTYLVHDGEGTHTVTLNFLTPNGGLASVTVVTDRH